MSTKESNMKSPFILMLNVLLVLTIMATATQQHHLGPVEWKSHRNGMKRGVIPYSTNFGDGHFSASSSIVGISQPGSFSSENHQEDGYFKNINTSGIVFYIVYIICGTVFVGTVVFILYQMILSFRQFLQRYRQEIGQGVIVRGLNAQSIFSIGSQIISTVFSDFQPLLSRDAIESNV